MADQTLDAKGLNCPLPILKARKALKDVADGGTLAGYILADIATVQEWLDQPGRLTRIDVRLDEDQVVAFRAALPDDVRLLDAEGRTRSTLEMSDAFMVNLNAMSLLALLVGLFLINLASGSAQQIEALDSIMGGPYTLVFWVLFVGIGLVVPLLLEVLEIRGFIGRVAIIAPVLVLLGGYALRQVALDIGQESTWTSYPTQYNAELMDRLRD